MRNILIFIGVITGVLFCILESVVRYSDTAPIDEEFGIEIISWKIYIVTMLIYSCIGGVVGFLAYKGIIHFKRNKNTNK